MLECTNFLWARSSHGCHKGHWLIRSRTDFPGWRQYLHNVFLWWSPASGGGDLCRLLRGCEQAARVILTCFLVLHSRVFTRASHAWCTLPDLRGHVHPWCSKREVDILITNSILQCSFRTQTAIWGESLPLLCHRRCRTDGRHSAGIQALCIYPRRLFCGLGFEHEG